MRPEEINRIRSEECVAGRLRRISGRSERALVCDGWRMGERVRSGRCEAKRSVRWRGG